jgi:hypothetical protein
MWTDLHRRTAEPKVCAKGSKCSSNGGWSGLATSRQARFAPIETFAPLLHGLDFCRFPIFRGLWMLRNRSLMA